MSKGVGTCNRDAGSEFLVASPKTGGDVSTKIGTAGFGCYRCKKRKTRCDPGLPRCRPCERVNVVCEYFDPIAGEMKPRIYGVHSQNRLQAFQQGMFPSMPEGETVNLTDASRSPGLSGNLTVGKQQLQESPTAADVSFDLSVEAPGVSGKRDLFKPIAQRHDLNTDYDGGYHTTPIQDWSRTRLSHTKAVIIAESETVTADDEPKSIMNRGEDHDKTQTSRSFPSGNEADSDKVPIINASVIERNSGTLSSETASPKPKRVKTSDDKGDPGARALELENELTIDSIAAVDYSWDLEKKTGSSVRRQACDRCRVQKMRCDAHLDGCATCIQNQSECKTTDRVAGKATVRGYVHSLERKIEQLRIRNREIELRLVSLGQDVKPLTDDGDLPLLSWRESFKDLPIAPVLPPTTAKPTHSSESSHNGHDKAVLQTDALVDQASNREPTSISPDKYSTRAEDPCNMLRPPPKTITNPLWREQQRTLLSRPRSPYHGKSPPTIAASVRGVVKTLELAYREAEELLYWITDKQRGRRVLTFTGLLKNSLRYNTEELEAAIKVREEGYGRELWFSLEDGIATEALQVFLVYFQVKVPRSLRSIRDSDSKVDLRNLIDASNFARMESIAVLDESSLRLAQTTTVTKRFAEESGMQTSPKSPASKNVAVHLGEAPWQMTSRVLHMPPEEEVVLPPRSGPGAFCEGAYHLWEGQQSKSFNIETRMESKDCQTHFWSCAIPDCAFEGPACKIGGTWTLDDTVREDLGVRYRWSFLAKFHLPTETLTGRKPDSFECILCIPGNLPLMRYRSEKAFMKHVANHAGQEVSWRAARKKNFICGRMALQEELFDINIPSPVKDVGPASGAAQLQSMDHMRLAPVGNLVIDATTPITNPDINKDCQHSRSKTKKPFDNDGHVITETDAMIHERRALVTDHESLRDTRDAAEPYPTPGDKSKRKSYKGRHLGRNFLYIPFSSSSDTSSIYSGSIYDSSTYGSKDDSSMTTVESSQMETRLSINDAEHFAMLRKLQEKAKKDHKGDSAGRMISMKPLDSCKDSESRVEAGSPHCQGSPAPISGSDTILSHRLSSNPEDLQAASNTTVANQFVYHKQESLTKEDTAASGRTSSEPAIGTIFNPEPVGKKNCEIEQPGDAVGHGRTEDNIHSDIEPIAKRSDALTRWLRQDREHSPIYFSLQPTEELRQPKHAEEIRLKANDEKIPFHGDTNDYNAVILTNKSATQHNFHDGLESVVRRPFWGFTFKHVFPLVALLGTYFIDIYEVKYHKTMGHIYTMNEKFNGCVSSVQIVAWKAVLWSSSKVLELNHRILASLYARCRNHAIEDSTSKMSKSLRTMNGQEYTTFNSAKLYAENLTGMQWDWWPYVASFRPLRPDEVRVEWQCKLRHTHWLEIPRAKVHLMVDTSGKTGPVKAVMRPSSATFAGHKAASNSSSSSQISRSRSSDGRSSPATSDTGCSSPPSDNAECDDDGLSEQEKDPSGDVVAVNIVPPSKLNGYVLFGVQGSKRLRSSKTRLTQIDLNVCKDDDSFFDEMKVQYKELRGYLRWIFSIWVFHTCEFIMFFKANPNEVMPGPEEMPSVTDMDYRFATDRYPPILSSVFNASFYGCNKACIKSRLDVMSIFHECKGRNHCGKYRVLERLPKRQTRWDIDRDHEKDEAWGLNATFGVSFYKVALYHLLILVGPTSFWGVWLRRWPTDWQNASVPFFAVVVLLSLFWLPFAQKVDLKEKIKHKIA